MGDQQNYLPNVRSFAVTAALFEGGLAVLAVSLGWALSIQPMETFRWSWLCLAWGVSATLPPLGLLVFCCFIPWQPFQRILRVLDQTLLVLFRDCRLFEIAIIALLAGLGEEMLFRSIVQGGLDRWAGPIYGPAIGLTLAAILFGLCHAITITYAILAAAIGFYLGALWLLTDNLLVPITAHAIYDFVAIIFLLKMQKPQVSEAGEEKESSSKPHYRKIPCGCLLTEPQVPDLKLNSGTFVDQSSAP